MPTPDSTVLSRDNQATQPTCDVQSFREPQVLRIAWFKAQSQQRRGRIRSLHQGKIVEVVIDHGCVGSSWLARARRGILKANTWAGAKTVQ